MQTYDLKKALLSHPRVSNMTKSIAVLTSGGDSQGMNAAIRSIVRTSEQMGLNVYLVKEGYYGLIEGGTYIYKAHWYGVSSILSLGGTFIGTKRCMEFTTREGRLKAATNMILLGISNLVVIGGDGSLTGASVFREEWPSYIDELHQSGKIDVEASRMYARLNLVGIVGSIDNDFSGTDMTIGTDTALHRILEAIDCIASTAFSHQRTFIMEVMGRTCGYLAIKSALMCEADYMFIREWPQKSNWPEKLCKNVTMARKMGKRLNIIIVSEGAVDESGNTITSEMVKTVLVDQLNQDARITVLGHVQRGGSPSAFDRTLATSMGAYAIFSLLNAMDENSQDENVAKVICLKSNMIIESSLLDCVQSTRNVAEAIKNKDFKAALDFRGLGFKKNLDTFKQMINQKTGLDEDGKRTLIFNVGGSSNGINALTYSIVRASISCNKKVYGARFGVDGILKGDIRELKWMDVTGWLNRGGVKLGITRTLPNAETLAKIAEKMKSLNISSCVIAGGLDALRTGQRMFDARNQFDAFCVPIIVVPVTYSNNVPGTDFSLGTDTALNQVVKLCDIIRQSAEGHTPRVFVVEVLGRNCGYLTNMAALACGADTSYIPEEDFNINDLTNCIGKMANKFATTNVTRGLVLRSVCANPNFSTSFIERLMTAEGNNLFTVRESILGSIASGGDPSPFDRSFALKEGQKTVEWINKMQEQYPSLTKSPDSAVLLGFKSNKYAYTPLEDLKSAVDRNQADSTIWWMKYRSLIKILEDAEYWKTI